jgi:hypothetical protein
MGESMCIMNSLDSRSSRMAWSAPMAASKWRQRRSGSGHLGYAELTRVRRNRGHLDACALSTSPASDAGRGLIRAVASLIGRSRSERHPRP